MSSLHPGDRHLHHVDGSHRWSGGPPDPRGHEAYLAALREHLRQHRSWPPGRSSNRSSDRRRGCDSADPFHPR
jgi:hypothetical protein